MGKVIDHNNFWYIEKNPISKTGVFPYLGREIGLPGLIPDKLYNVLRSEKELMSPEAMKSFELLPITKGHKMLGPSEEGFTPAEKIPQQGIVGEKVFAEGDTLYANIKVTSEQAKEDINNGLKELSLGYFCQWAKESGQYKGQPYDIVQKNIRGNHLAIVPLGRMGHSVRVMDALPQSAGSYACDSLELAGPLVGNSPKHSLRVFAEDEERWITIHPNGEENKGRRLGSFGVTKPSYIPPRPTLRMTQSFNKAKWGEIAHKLAYKIIEGKGSTIKDMGKLAALMAQDIQDTMINPGNYIPNSPMTIKRKGKNKPMRDTDTLLRSVTWAVKTRSEVEGNVL